MNKIIYQNHHNSWTLLLTESKKKKNLTNSEPQSPTAFCYLEKGVVLKANYQVTLHVRTADRFIYLRFHNVYFYIFIKGNNFIQAPSRQNKNIFFGAPRSLSFTEFISVGRFSIRLDYITVKILTAKQF